MTAVSVDILDEHVEGAVNFRDLGGYRAGGWRVRRGRVYRAGMTHHLSSTGLRALRDRYGIRTVIDLRSDEELRDDGVAPFHEAGIRHVHTPVFASLNVSQETRQVQLTAMQEGRYDWVASYRRMITEGGAAFRRSFGLLAQPEALPLVFHCTGGRDRTGVTAALLLSILGVAPDQVAHDYALTGTFLRPHIHRFGRPGQRMQIAPDAMARVLETSAESMTGFLTWLDGVHGSAEGYLLGLGITAEQIAAIRSTLVESAE